METEGKPLAFSAAAFSPAVLELASKIKMLVLDVDGVLTDGGLYYDPDGREMKRFHAQDGLGVKMLLRLDIRVGVITGLKSGAVSARIRKLGIVDYAEGIDQKLPVLDAMRLKYGLDWSEIAYVGDDWIDLGPFSRVGLPIAVANAQPEVKIRARYITMSCGGNGAVREVARLILTAQNKIDQTLAHWSIPPFDRG
ncbi:MAG: HAD-IIIA family hydrolase [Desulfovibrionaceae bacterium]|nr:HAD-IIIA family hydrolase [Desulfovibrionaceae bacterium]